MATSRHVVSIRLSIQVSMGTLGTPGLTLAQRRHLSSCRTNGFPTPAESNLSVRDLLRSAKNGTPKSFVKMPVTSVQRCIVSNAKTLGFNRLQFPERGQVADVQMGPTYSIIGRMSCLYSRTPFLTERPLILLRRGLNTSIL
jgi:hypothetical protein